MRDYVQRLWVSRRLGEPGLVSTAVLILTAIAFFRVALLPEMGRDLSMSTFQLGAVTTVFAVGRLLADLPGGHFADRLRATRLIALSATGVALGSLLLGLSVATLTVYSAAFVLGVSSATTNATGMTFFSNVAAAGRRGTSMAVFSAALLGGQAVGPAVAGLISAAGGWRLAMLVGAVGAAAMALVLLRARPRHPAAYSPGPAGGSDSHDTKSPRLGSLIVLQSVSFAVFFTLGAVPQTLVPLIGANDLGLTTAAIGLALGLGGFARFVGAIVGGRLSDRVSRRAALVPGLLVQAVGVSLLALEPSVVAWLSAIVIMSLASFAVSVAATILGDITEPSRIGTQLGRFRFVGDTGMIAGPLVVSSLFEGWGRAPAFGLVALVLVVPAVLSWRYLPDSALGTGE